MGTKTNQVPTARTPAMIMTHEREFLKAQNWFCWASDRHTVQKAFEDGTTDPMNSKEERVSLNCCNSGMAARGDLRRQARRRQRRRDHDRTKTATLANVCLKNTRGLYKSVSRRVDDRRRHYVYGSREATEDRGGVVGSRSGFARPVISRICSKIGASGLCIKEAFRGDEAIVAGVVGLCR